MAINFPLSPSLNDTYTYSSKTWKWNGTAWEKSAATETGNTEGNTGEVAYYGVKGSVIKGATAFKYDDTTGEVHFYQGISADAGATFGGEVKLLGNSRYANGGGIYTPTSGTLTARFSNDYKVELGDVEDSGAGNTLILDDDAEIATLNHRTFAHTGDLGATFSGPLYVAGGATFGGDVTIDSNFFNVKADIRHLGDTDTKITFTDDQITLRAGATNFITGTPTQVHMATGLSADAGATFGGPVNITNAGDVVLTINADTDNSGENDNPHINFTQDGGANTFQMGMVGAAGQIYTGSRSDVPYIKSYWGMQLSTNNTKSIDIDRYGLVHLSGGLSADAGATFGGAVTAPTFVGALTGNVTGNVTGNASGTSATVTTAAQPNITSVGILTSLQTSGGISAGAGSTFGGDVHFGGNLILPEDGEVQIGGDTEKIIFNGGSAIINLIAGQVSVGSGGGNGYIQSYGDNDTNMRYQADQWTLKVGGTNYIDVTTAGTNFADTDVVRPNLKDYSETVNAIGTITGNTAVSFAAGNVQTVTGNGDCLFTFTNPPASGKSGTLTMIITNGGANTTTWHSSVKWPGDNAPALTASGVDVVSFMTIDAGTTVYGFVGGIAFA